MQEVKVMLSHDEHNPRKEKGKQQTTKPKSEMDAALPAGGEKIVVLTA